MARSRENWDPLVDELSRGGMTQVQFARRRAVALSTLQYWVRKLRRERETGRGRSKRLKFVRVCVREGTAADRQQWWEAQVGTMRLRFEVGTDTAYVAAVLERLGS